MEICELCGGTNLQAKYWVDLNSKKVKDLVPPNKDKAVWCSDCEEHVDTKQG